MKIIIVAIGSQGDVNPFLKIGITLQQRGHDVIFLTNSYFKKSVEVANLDFISVGSREDFNKMVAEVDLKKSTKCTKAVLNHLYFPPIQTVYDAIKEKHIPGNTVILSITLAFGAKLAQEKLGIPLVTCHMSPISFRSSYHPARHDGLWMPPWLPKFYKDSVWRLIDLVADKILGPPINEMCSKLNLPPAKYIMKNWIHSDDKVMGFFPDWFAEPQPDWPKNTELTDFVFFDEAEMKPMSSELEKFISQGEPPVIFTPGTAVKNADLFFKASIKACEILNTRAVFLSSYRDQIPDNLPKNIYYCRYAPFSKLFPHASTVVHHGGIGTCAQALRAGIPQLIVPFGFDQHDNSLRLRKLGVGSELSIKKYTGFTAADKLRALIENKDAYAQCKKISDKIEDNDSLTKICKIVERMVRR